MKLRLLIALALLGLSGVALANINYRQPAAAPGAALALPADTTDLGPLVFRGAVNLAQDGQRMGGVSGLEAEVSSSGATSFHAVTDEGRLLEFTGVFDKTHTLIGFTGLTSRRIPGEGGKPLEGKQNADAEDITLFPGSPGVAIAFERRHRIVAYRPAEEPLWRPLVMASPDLSGVAANSGMEAIAVVPGNLMAVGVQDKRIWVCEMASGPCRETAVSGAPGLGFDLSGFDSLSGTNDLIALYRSYGPMGGDFRIVRLRRAEGQADVYRAEQIARLARTPPNFEGITAVRRPQGGYRLYLVSDNGLSDTEPTMLLALDWPAP